MRPISKKVKAVLEKDPWMKKCCYCGTFENIEWNHAIQYAGKQLDEVYCLTPLCRNCHRGYSGTIKSEIKEFCEFLAITRGLPNLIKKYPKFKWLQRKTYLQSKLVKKIYRI